MHQLCQTNGEHGRLAGMESKIALVTRGGLVRRIALAKAQLEQRGPPQGKTKSKKAMKRECGGCTACCFIGGIPELNKPGHTVCSHACAQGCDVYGTPAKPETCDKFSCAWWNGIGSPADRPDLCGVMLSINDMGVGDYAFAIELREGAARGSGAGMIAAMAARVPLPIVIVSHGSLPPNDSGDFVAVTDLVRERRKVQFLTGKLIAPIGGVPTYEIVRL